MHRIFYPILIGILAFPFSGNAKKDDAATHKNHHKYQKKHPNKNKKKHKKHTHSLKRRDVEKISKELFSKADLSRYDRNIESILDQEHLSPQELEILKAQSLLSFLEEDIYSLYDDVLDQERLTFPDSKRKGELFQDKKSPPHTGGLHLATKLREELIDFSNFLKKFAADVVKDLKTFQKSDDMRGFSHPSPQPIMGKTKEPKEAIDAFLNSDRFRKLQESASDAVRRVNKALENSGRYDE